MDDAKSWVDKGDEFYDKDEYEQAIDAYKKATEINPDYFNGWHCLGTAYHWNKQYEKAIEALKRALQIDPEWSWTWYYIGLAKEELKDVGGAIEAYEKSVSIDPGDTIGNNYKKAYGKMGFLKMDLDDLDGGEEAFKMALKIDREYDMAWYNLACVESLRNNLDKAINNLKEAIKLDAEYWRDSAKTDSDFDNIKDSIEFKKLVYATQFVKVEDKTVYSNCVEYQNEEGKIIHLVPVMHIGEERYYKDIIDYVGNRHCLYESIKVRYDKQIEDLPENITIHSDYKDILEVFKKLKFYSINEEQFEKMLDDEDEELPFETTLFLGMAVEKMEGNEEAEFIFEICEAVYFSLDALSVLQRYMAEQVGLLSQNQVIDYPGEISKLDNWEHLDLDMVVDSEDLEIEFTPEFIHGWCQQMNLTLGAFLGCMMLQEEETIKLKRKKFIDMALPTLTTKPEPDLLGDALTEFLLELRNKIVEEFLESPESKEDEIVIFYGPVHLMVFEDTLIEQGFEAKKETRIKIFSFE